MPVNQEIQVKIFVDDVNADSIAGAFVKINPNANATTTIDTVRTGSDGSATFGLTALNGPQISIDFEITSPGYQDGKKTIDIIVDTPPGGIAEIQLPPELVYVIIGGIAVVAIVVVLFLKKSKEPTRVKNAAKGSMELFRFQLIARPTDTAITEARRNLTRITRSQTVIIKYVREKEFN